MKTIYHISLDSPEVQGIFDVNGNLLGAWSSNDANWRSEYFSEFMEQLGIREENPSKSLRDNMKKKLSNYFKGFE